MTRSLCANTAQTLVARRGSICVGYGLPMIFIASEKQDQNRAAIDPWTIVHFSSGLACGLVDFPFKWSVAAATAYEFVEHYAERHDWGKSFFETSGPESLPNSIVDVVVFAIGHRLGTKWNRTLRKATPIRSCAGGVEMTP